QPASRRLHVPECRRGTGWLWWGKPRGLPASIGVSRGVLFWGAQFSRDVPPLHGVKRALQCLPRRADAGGMAHVATTALMKEEPGTSGSGQVSVPAWIQDEFAELLTQDAILCHISAQGRYLE